MVLISGKKLKSKFKGDQRGALTFLLTHIDNVYPQMISIRERGTNVLENVERFKKSGFPVPFL